MFPRSLRDSEVSGDVKPQSRRYRCTASAYVSQERLRVSGAVAAAPALLELPLAARVVPAGSVLEALGADEAAEPDEGGRCQNTADPLCECVKTKSGRLLMTFERVMEDGRLRRIAGTSQSTDNGTAVGKLV